MHLLFIFILISLFACGQQSPKIIVSPQAKQLTDSAINKAMYEQDYKQALLLLNKAIKIDSNYFLAYQNKLTFETSLKEYKDALQTTMQLIRLQPDAPDYYVTAGVLHSVEGNSFAATEYWQKALIKFEKAIEETNKTDYNYPMLLTNKAVHSFL
jgi:tetratricopeptide (TPR) repeat protein